MAWSQVQERRIRAMADNAKFGVVTPAPKSENVGEKPGSSPRRVFHERTGQNLWDIPALRRVFSQLKKEEITRSVSRAAIPKI